MGAPPAVNVSGQLDDLFRRAHAGPAFRSTLAATTSAPLNREPHQYAYHRFPIALNTPARSLS
jgi:hypothetical protein